MESSVIDVFRQVFSLLDARERLRFLFLTVLMVVVALIEVAGVSSVLILLNVLANPESITTNPWLSWAYGLFDFQSNFSFQVALALLVTGVVIFGLAIKAIGNYTIVRFGYMRGAAIATRLLGRYLSQPYAWFLERNSSEVSKNVLNEVDGLVMRVITPLRDTISTK